MYEPTMKIDLCSKLLGWFLPIILPTIHIASLWLFWGKYHFPVDRATCTCECWDSIFKGPYESGVGVYKHFYFNATKNVIKIWMIASTGIVLLYECVKYLVELLLRGKLRFSMLVLFLSSIFPHYYSWWTYINYLNDDFYVQWNHQLFFTLTEMLSTAIVLHLMNIHREFTDTKLLVIIAISTIHMISGGIDQFITNVLMLEGSAHQIIRDFGFMIPDTLHIVIPMIEMYDLRCSDYYLRKWYKDEWYLLKLLFTSVLIIIGCCIVYHL